MKSFQLKIATFIAFIMLACIGTTSAQRLTIAPVDDATLAEHLQQPDARTLIAYLAQNGYADVGNLAEGTKKYTDATNRDFGTVILVTKTFSKPGAENITFTTSSETQGQVRDYYIAASDSKNEYRVVAGAVTVAAKSSISLAKILECFNKYLKGNTQSCVTCYNCLKNCIQNNSGFWSSLSCCLGNCYSSCFNCISSIWKFLKCVF